MTDWPANIEEWIKTHPEHILYQAAQLRYRESREAFRRHGIEVSIHGWEHALMAVKGLIFYYKRVHHIHDFEKAAEQTFRVYAERRLKGCHTS